MHATLHTLDIVTAADGSATVFTDGLTGAIETVVYVPDATAPFDATADFTLTIEATGQAVLSKTDVSAAFTNAPRQTLHTTNGTVALYASGGIAVLGKIIAAASRLKLVVAQGGDTKAGQLLITVS